MEKNESVESPSRFAIAAQIMADALTTLSVERKVYLLNTVPQRALDEVIPFLVTAAKDPENEVERNIRSMVTYSLTSVPPTRAETHQKIKRFAEFLKTINEPRTFKDDELRTIEELQGLFRNLEKMGKEIAASERDTAKWWREGNHRFGYWAERAMTNK